MKPLFAILALAGCQLAADIPSRPVDTPYVTFGNGGSITGGGLITTVYANDQLYRRYTSPRPGEGRTEWQQLPDGSFQDIKSVALDQITRLSQEPQPTGCLDAGTDSLVVVDFDFAESRFDNDCPSNAARAAFSVLRATVAKREVLAEAEGQ